MVLLGLLFGFWFQYIHCFLASVMRTSSVGELLVPDLTSSQYCCICDSVYISCTLSLSLSLHVVSIKCMSSTTQEYKSHGFPHVNEQQLSHMQPRKKVPICDYVPLQINQE